MFFDTLFLAMTHTLQHILVQIATFFVTIVSNSVLKQLKTSVFNVFRRLSGVDVRGIEPLSGIKKTLNLLDFLCHVVHFVVHI